jgi:hypothetical protein
VHNPKIVLPYYVAQSVSNCDNDGILREDNIHNIVRLQNEKSQFTRTLETDHDVRIFLERRRKYHRICTVVMRHDCVEQHIKVYYLLYVIRTG